MLLVIFGAGASYDSSPTYAPGVMPVTGPGGALDDYFRPPLARDLFANRPLFVNAVELFPQCKTIVPRLRDAAGVSGGKSLEVVLQEIEEQAKTYSRGVQEMAAVRCYLQRAISDCETKWRSATGGITNYLTLLREIERLHKRNEPVCLVTFNYDTLLESALEHFDLKLRQMKDYMNGSPIVRLFKLHGSVNWARKVGAGVPASLDRNNGLAVLQYLVRAAHDLQISDDFVICDPENMGSVDGKLVFPAIAVPIENKSTFQCPSYMVEELINLLPQTSKIIVIGWRASETHFLNLLKKHVARGTFMSVVAGGQADADEIRSRIHLAMPNNQPSSVAESTGFTQFIRTGRAEKILEF